MCVQIMVLLLRWVVSLVVVNLCLVVWSYECIWSWRFIVRWCIRVYSYKSGRTSYCSRAFGLGQVLGVCSDAQACRYCNDPPVVGLNMILRVIMVVRRDRVVQLCPAVNMTLTKRS